MSSSKQSSGRSTAISGVTGLIILVVAVIISLLGGPGSEQVTPTPGTPATTAAVTTVVTPASSTEVADSSLMVPVPAISQGFSDLEGFWAVYFTAPTGSRDAATYTGGIDGPLAQAINDARGSIDMAAFEFNNVILTKALLLAKQRGVTVRIVTDNEHGIDDPETSLHQLVDAGIPVVPDDRSALMHNKFVIIDSTVVFTGSLNYTINGVYRNNNNLLMMRSQRAVQSYEAEFSEMFVQKEFGPRSPTGNAANYTQDGDPIQILFAPEDDVVGAIIDQVNSAQSNVRFMAFSYTLDNVGEAMIQRASANVDVQGIFENVGSETSSSELTPLFCAGLAVRQDGNPFVLHHKVIIIDDSTVLTGSFNFSASATRSNDENMVIIQDHDLAAQYIAEFDRRWAEATTPTDLSCS